MNKTKNVNINLGLGSPLFIVFLVLKLTHYIDWSWWWVTAPLWIPFAIFFVFMAIVFGLAMIGALLKG